MRVSSAMLVQEMRRVAESHARNGEARTADLLRRAAAHIACEGEDWFQRLVDQTEETLEVLAPFEAEAATWGSEFADDYGQRCTEEGAAQFTVGSLRRAAQFRAKLLGNGLLQR